MVERCASCGKRKGMRDCPALGKRVCPACCGTKRLKQIACPAICAILEAARPREMAVTVGSDDLFDVKASPVPDEAGKAALLYHMQTGKCPFTEGECSPGACPRGGMEMCPMHGGDAAG